MAIYNDAVQTGAGRALENRARSGEGAIEFTYIETGSGLYTEEDISGTVAALERIGEKYSLTFVLSISMDAHEMPEAVQKDIIVSL